MSKRAKKSKGDDAPAGEEAVSLASHPEAAGQIRQAKGWGGLLGLVLVAFVTWRGGGSLEVVAEYALIGGVVGFVLAWALMLNVWRHMALADITRKRRQAEEAYRSYLEELDSRDGDDASAPAA